MHYCLSEAEDKDMGTLQRDCPLTACWSEVDREHTSSTQPQCTSQRVQIINQKPAVSFACFY